MTVQKKILDLTGSQYLVQKVKSAINDVDSSLSTHIADTDIHVTTADKNRWNNNTYVFRYSSTALVASSTNSNALLDNTDNLKVGDKVIDSSGVLFSITAIDTQNSTFTIGTALIDLAQDSDVVHNSGEETVGGRKTFTDVITNNITNKANAYITLKNSSYDPKTNGQSNANSGSFSIGFNTLTDDSFAWISAYGLTDYTMLRLTTTYFTDSENSITDSIEYKIYQNGDRTLRPRNNNNCMLGETSRRWSKIYGTEYYYGSNNVEFSQKFVTTDTNQTISGNKTFEGVNINFKSSTSEYGVSGGGLSVIYSDKNSVNLAQIKLGNYTSGVSYTKFSIFAYDSNNQLIDRTLTYSSSGSSLATAYFRPDNDNIVSLGTTSNRWSRVYATNYYYGNDNIEFSTKFVTTDTAQTISGNKTFSSNVNVYNSDSATDTANIVLKNSKAERGSTTNIGEQNISFVDKNNNQLGNIKCITNSSGVSNMYISCNASGNDNGVRLSVTSNTTYFRSNINNNCKLGTADVRWSDVQTYKVNNLEPSSLSLPSYSSSRIDISSYITNLTGGNGNEYTVPANGYIFVRTANGTYLNLVEYPSGACSSVCSQTADDIGTFLPVIAGRKCIILIKCSSVDRAYFIPCQGNV